MHLATISGDILVLRDRDDLLLQLATGSSLPWAHRLQPRHIYFYVMYLDSAELSYITGSNKANVRCKCAAVGPENFGFHQMHLTSYD